MLRLKMVFREILKARAADILQVMEACFQT